MTPADPQYQLHEVERAATTTVVAVEDEPTLADYVGILLGARWLIAATCALAVAVGVAYVVIATPRYRSDILVQIEEKNGGLGIDALNDMFSGATPADTEIEIVRSRMLVGSVVDELRLDVVTQPRTAPLVGRALFRRWSEDGLRAPLLGLSRYAWGGERIALSRIDVPEAWLGQPLTLVAKDGGAYELRGPDDEKVLEGRVGAVASANGVTLFVSELRARPGTEFTVARLNRTQVVADLQGDLQISEKGKKTGILQVALEGDDPRRTADILDAVSRSYLRQNVERKSAEAEKTLEFLETQLPELKTRLETAEAKLEAYRATKGSVDVSLETQAMLTRAVELEKGLSELQVQGAELKQRFTRSHPAVAALDDKIAQLEAERASMDARLKRLPQAELDSARLIRDAKVAQELYVLLLNKAQELRVVKSGTIGNVRILDSAVVPVEPVSPKKAQTLALSLVLGLALGVGLAFVRRALVVGVEDPEAIERDTGLAIYATVPRSDREARIDRARESKVLAAVDPADPATESLRSLRTSLQFALMDAPNGIISVLGPAPSVGKTFTSVNLAAVLAEAGKHVLLVDADLRKGRIHHFFGGRREHGLSELIAGEAKLADVVRTTPVQGLHVLATGRTPPNPAGLLGSDRFAELLGDLARRYDHVVLDTSPVLAVTDAALVARHAGVNLLVLRAGRHPTREITATLKRLQQAGVSVSGAVLNDVQPRTGYGYGYSYQYAYDRKKAEE